MQSIEDTMPASLTAVLERVVDQMKRASGAQIVTLYLYDAESQSYFAPTAIGLPDSNLGGALSDMQDQLSRYLADAGQGRGRIGQRGLGQQFGRRRHRHVALRHQMRAAPRMAHLEQQFGGLLLIHSRLFRRLRHCDQAKKSSPGFFNSCRLLPPASSAS